MDVRPGPGAPASSGAQSRAEVRSLATAPAAPGRSGSPRASCQQLSLGFLQPSSLKERGETCLQPKPHHVSEPESNMETSPPPRNALTNPNFIEAKLGSKSEQRTVQEEMR